MDDSTYMERKAELLRAEAGKHELMTEARARRDVYVLHAWYLHSQVQWEFFTLAEAMDRAADDCSPVKIVAPDGTELNPYTGDAS